MAHEGTVYTPTLAMISHYKNGYQWVKKIWSFQGIIGVFGKKPIYGRVSIYTYRYG
jgi:hypothetical protein